MARREHHACDVAACGLVAFLVGELHLSYLKAGAALAGAQAAGALARLVMGFLSDRSSDRTLLIGPIGLLIAAAGLAALARPSWPEQAVFALFLLCGAGALGWNGVMLAELAHTATQDKAGEVAYASSALAFAGAVAGLALFAALLGSAGYAGSFALLSLAVLLCNVSLIRFDLRPVA